MGAAEDCHCFPQQREMSCSAVFILDAKGKIIINRNYRGDVPMTVAEKFSQYISGTEEEDLRPVVVDNGIIFVYVKYTSSASCCCCRAAASADSASSASCCCCCRAASRSC